MILQRLLQGYEIRYSPSVGQINLTQLTNDSREVVPGSLFVAVEGFATDGHKFIEQAFAAGAEAVLAEHNVDLSGFPADRILVNPLGDNRRLLSKLSAVFYQHPWMEMRTAGITGTNGKTSTAHMLRWMLEKNGIQTGIMGTVGHVVGGKSIEASVTTPDSLQVSRYMRQMADSGDRACVMEVSSHALSLDRVSSVRFNVGLFTNISQDHLDFHKDMQEYLAAKMKLFSLLKDNGISIVGTYAPNHPTVKGAVTFGESADDTWRILHSRITPTGSNFVLRHRDEEIPVSISAPGHFNIYNAAGALAGAVELGIPARAAADALSSFRGVPGRMESVNCGQSFLVAVDYAHTPDALERVLSQGKKLARGRLIAVFGCGGDRDSSKRPLMGAIASRESDVVVVTSDNPRTEDPEAIISDILEGITDDAELIVEADRATAITRAITGAEEGDVVIIAGKGHEDYQILGREKIHFDDREQASIALEKRGYQCGH